MTSVARKSESPNSSPASSALARLMSTDLAGEVEFLAARARALGTGTANEFLAPLNLRVRSYSVLALACSGENPSQRDLAEFLSLDASQIVPLVDELESRGLVIRSADPRDRRSNSIEATADGRALYATAKAAITQAEAASLGALTAQERDTLRSLLRRIAFPQHE